MDQNNSTATASLHLGLSGDMGSFSEEAALQYCQTHKLQAKFNYLIDMENVLHALNEGQIDLGIFPVVNLTGGLVRMAFDAMGRYSFKVIDELWLDVKQCLMLKKNSNIHQIKKIVSHSQALAQCKNYLKLHFPQAELVEWQDTAKAAKDLAEGKLSHECAAIAPARCAKLYKLNLLEEGIQDQKPNFTAFIIVKRLEN